MLYYTTYIMDMRKMITPVKTPALPCPKCRQTLRLKGKEPTGANRIGNRRSSCDICNNFSQNVMRMTRKRLKELHEEEYQLIRMQVELDLYPQVIADWNAEYPDIRAEDIELDENGMMIK